MNGYRQGLSGNVMFLRIMPFICIYTYIVSVTLNEISSKIEKGGLLLTLRPIRIAGKDTKSEFYDWSPPETYV